MQHNANSVYREWLTKRGTLSGTHLGVHQLMDVRRVGWRRVWGGAIVPKDDWTHEISDFFEDHKFNLLTKTDGHKIGTSQSLWAALLRSLSCRYQLNDVHSHCECPSTDCMWSQTTFNSKNKFLIFWHRQLSSAVYLYKSSGFKEESYQEGCDWCW